MTTRSDTGCICRHSITLSAVVLSVAVLLPGCGGTASSTPVAGHPAAATAEPTTASPAPGATVPSQPLVSTVGEPEVPAPEPTPGDPATGLAQLADADPDARLMALDSLLANPDVAPLQLHLLLHDEDPLVREEMIEALLDASPANLTLLTSVLDDPDASVRETAVVMAASRAGPAATGLLQQALADPDPTVAAMARALLCDLAPTQCTGH